MPLDQGLDGLRDKILAEAEGDDGLGAAAGHRERKAVRHLLGVAQRAGLGESGIGPVLLERLIAEMIEIGRTDAGLRGGRLVLEMAVAAFTLVHPGIERRLGAGKRNGIFGAGTGDRQHDKNSGKTSFHDNHPFNDGNLTRSDDARNDGGRSSATLWISCDTLSDSFRLFALRQNAAAIPAHEMSTVFVRAVSARHHVNAIVSTLVV